MEENFTAAVDAAEATEAVATEEVGTVAEETVPQKKQRRPINQQKLQDNLWGWIFILPLVIGTVWFVYFAIVLAVIMSFTSYTTGGSVSLFQALGNLSKYSMSESWAEEGGAWHWYYQIFTETCATYGYEAQGNGMYQMNEAGAYLFNTVFYMIGIPIGMVLAVFFAVCMSRDIKGGNVFRVLYYLPCVASSVAIVYTFKLLFKQEGVINQLLGLTSADRGGAAGFLWIPTGSGSGQQSWASITGNTSATSVFMTDPYWCQGIITKSVIVIMSVWKGLGGTIILYAAGLSGVNASTKEAAEIDGANGWKIFWKITMPDLYPVIFYNIVTSVIGGLQIYAEPEMLYSSTFTSGYVALIYNYGMSQSSKYIGAASAYGILLMIIILILTLFQFWLDARNAE